MKQNTYFSDLKVKEELELDLQEIKAYRSLESQEFNFNGQVIKNTGEFNLGSEDAYYEMNIQSLEDTLDNWDDNLINNKPKKHKDRLNSYQKKIYWHRDKLLEQIKNHMPNHSYNINYDDNEKVYYQRCYQGSKEIRKSLCRQVRRKINRCIDEDYDVCSTKGMNWKKIYNYKWDIW